MDNSYIIFDSIIKGSFNKLTELERIFLISSKDAPLLAVKAFIN